jgi:D-lactate dehydrogenase (cytochrome)
VERFEIADEEDMDELWEARKEMAFAIQTYEPDLQPLHPGDITVPISKLPEIIRYIKDLSAEHDTMVPCFGHAGDGNLHYSVMADLDDPESIGTAETIYSAVVERAIEMGGTCTGEHGIGRGKRKYLELEHGEGTVESMRSLKRALDPKDTLNPGKIFPETASGERVRADPTDD